MEVSAGVFHCKISSSNYLVDCGQELAEAQAELAKLSTQVPPFHHGFFLFLFHYNFFILLTDSRSVLVGLEGVKREMKERTHGPADEEVAIVTPARTLR